MSLPTRSCVALLGASFLIAAGCVPGDSGSMEPISVEELQGDAQSGGISIRENSDLTTILFGLAAEVDEQETEAVPPDSIALTPPSCVTVEEVSMVQTRFTLTGCRGPFGRVPVDGVVTTTLVPESLPIVEFAVTSMDLSVGPRTIETLDARITYDASVPQVTVTTSLVGVQGQLSTDITMQDTGDGCAQFDGTWTSTAGERNTDIAVAGAVRCAMSCGFDSGTATLERSGARRGDTTITMTDNGGGSVSWATTEQMGELMLMCPVPGS